MTCKAVGSAAALQWRLAMRILNPVMCSWCDADDSGRSSREAVVTEVEGTGGNFRAKHAGQAAALPADAFIALGLPTEQNASEHPQLVVSALLENQPSPASCWHPWPL